MPNCTQKCSQRGSFDIIKVAPKKKGSLLLPSPFTPSHKNLEKSNEKILCTFWNFAFLGPKMSHCGTIQ